MSSKKFSIFVIYMFSIFSNMGHTEGEQSIKYNEVVTWVDKLSFELWHVGDFITSRKEVEDSFKSIPIVQRNGEVIVRDMALDIKNMMEAKISAVQRIMENAETTAMSHKDSDVNLLFQYFNAKEMLEEGEPLPTKRPPEFNENPAVTPSVDPKYIVLNTSRHFFNIPVNTNVSSVHVPTNVFDRSPHVIKAIQWSEKLDLIFRNNYQKDPTLSWQFFGSSTGFMRQFPASKWNKEVVDLFDCRLRSWYINAANSPKDIIILIDYSGSMTGARKDIAINVVRNILDTLGTNDFVNIFTFAEELNEVVPCFKDNLVQANMENVRELKLGLEDFNTTDIANFTAALTKAFDILEKYRTERMGAKCNQAIMLISDGVPYNYKEIFEMYNWLNNSFIPVRVFTFLIGREVADVKEIKWMACQNRGYYVHLSTQAEVREQVLNYIAVMARPLVLNRQDHPVIWSNVYADVVDPIMTDWLWEVKECKEQKERFLSERKNREKFHSKEEEERRNKLKIKENQDQSTNSKKYVFMTTVSMPVFDRRENANITEDVLINEAYWVTITRETRIANLLGVAGTDIPIADIKQLMMPFMLGVNGYAFIVTNNGYVLTHPDLRPVFQEILKPAYNSVDMLEVELMDDDSEPRNFSEKLMQVRNSIINQTKGAKWIMMKQHLDNMKRVSRVKRQYYWTGIKNTPFTLVISFPEDVGLYRLQHLATEEIHRLHVNGVAIKKFFNGTNWRIHPDWLYCKHSVTTFDTPEEELNYFLDKMSSPGWKWPASRTHVSPEHSNTTLGRSTSFEDAYYCDRSLMQSVVLDARQTQWFPKNFSAPSAKEDKGTEFKQRFGITVTFLATHSGLTRWHEFNPADEARPEHDFSENNKRAVDEIWYRRAVEQHTEDPLSFVYSVPFDIGIPSMGYQNDTLVTASHAVFITQGDRSAPAAVVGYQFQHSSLVNLFKNITNTCNTPQCNKTCASEDIDCFVLDNNGYVVIGSLNDTGKFFGDVRPSVMFRLVAEKIYREIEIFDYQAVCFVRKDQSNFANFLRTPLFYLAKAIRWTSRFIVLLFFKLVNAYESYSYASEDVYSNYIDNIEPTERYDLPLSKARELAFDKRVLINKTRPEPCDQRIKLYQLNNDKNLFKSHANQCERPFVVLPIPKSNLIILVVDTICPFAPPDEPITILPMEIVYNSSLACLKSSANLARCRPASCINQHYNESQIEMCGKGFKLVNRNWIISLSLLAAFGYVPQLL